MTDENKINAPEADVSPDAGAESLEEKEASAFESGQETVDELSEKMRSSAEEAAGDFSEGVQGQAQVLERRYNVHLLNDETAQVQELAQKADQALSKFESAVDGIVSGETEVSSAKETPPVDSGEKVIVERHPSELSVTELGQEENALNKEWERLSQLVAEEGANEKKAMKKALKTGIMPEVSEAGKQLNEVHRRLLEVQAETAKRKEATAAEKADASARADADLDDALRRGIQDYDAEQGIGDTEAVEEKPSEDVPEQKAGEVEYDHAESLQASFPDEDFGVDSGKEEYNHAESLQAFYPDEDFGVDSGKKEAPQTEDAEGLPKQEESEPEKEDTVSPQKTVDKAVEEALEDIKENEGAHEVDIEPAEPEEHQKPAEAVPVAADVIEPAPVEAAEPEPVEEIVTEQTGTPVEDITADTPEAVTEPVAEAVDETEARSEQDEKLEAATKHLLDDMPSIIDRLEAKGVSVSRGMTPTQFFKGLTKIKFITRAEGNELRTGDFRRRNTIMNAFRQEHKSRSDKGRRKKKA